MENSLYYTFSTIAQVLAGFLALSGVFVLYKFEQYLTLQTFIIRSFIKEYLEKYNENEAIRLIRDLEDSIGLNDLSKISIKLIRFSESIYIKPLGTLSEDTKLFANVISTIEKNKIKLLKLTKASIMVGLSIILYSFAILVNVDYIILHLAKYRFWFFAPGILGASLCLGLMSYLILISLKIKSK